MSVLLESINKRFGPEQVLSEVSDLVPDGTITALLGPSGSGKSTLLKIIAGIEQPDSGRIVLHNRDVTNIAPRFRKIGFCFQDYAPFMQMTVFDNVAFGLRSAKVPKADVRKKVNELLALVRLSDYAGRYPRQLSGGQKQRMALARALAIEPEVLLLDEPFAALDAQVSAELRTWVMSLQRELGITTIMVTHNQAEAMEMGDRLVILNQGKIEQVGSPIEVYDRPANDFVRGFLGPVTMWQGEAIRPHDLELCGESEGELAHVVSVTRLGFEVRVVLRVEQGQECWMQVTHDEAAKHEVKEGSTVRIRRTGLHRR